jgi:cellulose synthase (UDP-forming)
MFYLMLPIGHLLFGWNPVQASLGGIIEYWAPYYAFYLLTFNWLAGGKRSAFWSDVYETLVCFPMASAVAATLLRPFGRSFQVTPKGIATRSLSVNWPIALPLLGMAVLCASGIAMKIAADPFASTHSDSTLINLVWNAYNLALLSVALQGTMDVPQERKYLRFPHATSAHLDVKGQILSVQTIDLSEGGARLQYSSFVNSFDRATISFPEIGLHEIECRCKRVDDADGIVTVRFERLPLNKLRRLIEYLYCREGSWMDRELPESRSLFDFARATVRLFPLCESRLT